VRCCVIVATYLHILVCLLLAANSINSHIPLQHIRVIFCLLLTANTDTGWRRLIGSPKLQITFHKRATKYRALLRKMTYKDKGSCESSPLCNSQMPVQHIHMKSCATYTYEFVYFLQPRQLRARYIFAIHTCDLVCAPRSQHD